MEHNTKSLSKNMTKHFIVIVLKLKTIITRHEINTQDNITSVSSQKYSISVNNQCFFHQTKIFIFIVKIPDDDNVVSGMECKADDTLPREMYSLMSKKKYWDYRNKIHNISRFFKTFTERTQELCDSHTLACVSESSWRDVKLEVLSRYCNRPKLIF